MTRKFDKSLQLQEKARRCDAWASTTPKNYYSIEGRYPIYSDYAKDQYLWDIDGNKYIDYILGYGTIILGHAQDRILKPVIEEIKRGNITSPLWKPFQVELTALLTSVIPGAEKAFLMKTGSDATSGCVRLARIYTKKEIVLKWGYNGWHDWTTPKPEGVPKTVKYLTKEFIFNDIESLHKLFREHKGNVACVIMMPFEEDPPQEGFLENVKNLAHDYGALFILDEMRSGFRMSLGGAQQYFNIQSDLSTFSKAMSNGFAISAIVGKASILECMEKTKMTATYFCSSFEMIAAIETIKYLQDTDALSRIWSLGARFIQGLEMLVKKFSFPGSVVGYPPMPFLRIHSKDELKTKKIKAIVFSKLAELGVLFHPNHHWYISSSHTLNDIEETMRCFEMTFEYLYHEFPDLIV